MDTNKDGFVDKYELKSMLEKLGQEATDEEVEELIACSDCDCDGKVSFEEFLKAATSDAQS